MLSSLFEKRNQSGSQNQNKALFEVVTKKVQLPKVVVSKQTQKQQIQSDNKSKTQQKKQIIQQDRPQATIFIGNVHLTTKHSELRKQFQKYGKIQKIWFRSIPVQVNKMGRKANLILKKFVQGADSMNAYIRFEKQQSAQQACKQNGQTFKDLTIRVSLCKQKDTDTQSTVFVGNLSHDIKQQELRNHFASIGKILSVRVIKSRQTNKGIGIGYVHYSTKQQMKEAINKLNGTELLGRNIRVKKAVANQRLEKKQKKIQQKYGKKYKGKNQYQNKNAKAIQIRKKGKQIKMNREANKTKQIRK